MKITQTEKYIAVPESLINSKVSLEALGYYCVLCANNTLDDIDENLASELAEYVEFNKQADIKNDAGKIQISDTSNEFLAILDRQVEDEKLKQALKKYIDKRTNPPEGSRFEGTEEKFKPFNLILLLKQLEPLSNKVDVVEFCTEREYFKFFELDPLDTVKSGTYEK